MYLKSHSIAILHVFRFLVFLSLLVSLISVSRAQSSTDNVTPGALKPGSPAGSYALEDFDTVNLYNGHLNFILPLLKMGGRGSAAIPIVYKHEQIWRDETYYACQPCGPLYYPTYNWWTTVRPIYGMGFLEARDSQDASQSCPEPIEVYSLTRLTFTAADGTEYELVDQATSGKPERLTCALPPPNRGKIFATIDGSQVTFISDTNLNDWGPLHPTGYLMMKDGARYRIEDGYVKWVRDRNGNRVTVTYGAPYNSGNGTYYRPIKITDSLNREVTIEYDVNDVQPYGLCDRITYTGFNGQPRVIRISKRDLDSNYLRSGYVLRSDADLFPHLNGASAQVPTTGPRVTTAIWLPDGRAYRFYYNDYYELARVILPTSGALEYDYASNFNTVAQGIATSMTNRRVIEKRVYPDGGSGSAWVGKTTFLPYSMTQGEPVGAVAVTTRNSSNTIVSKSRHYFLGYALPIGYNPTEISSQVVKFADPSEGREYRTEQLGADGSTVLRTINHAWASRLASSLWSEPYPPCVNCTPFYGPPVDPRITETASSLNDTNQLSKQTFSYDQYNNRTDIYEYDYGPSGSGQLGGLIRHTHTNYMTSPDYVSIAGGANADATATIYLRSLPSTEQVFNGGGTLRAQTDYEYDIYVDNGWSHDDLMDRTGISGLVSRSGQTPAQGYNPTTDHKRGNVTKVTRYLLNSGGGVTGSVTTFAQYDVAGNTVKAIDAGRADGSRSTTTFEFTDRFGVPDGEAQSDSGAVELGILKSYAFPTRVANALQQVTYTQFDYYLGQPVDSEDANGTVTSSRYGTVENDPYLDLLDRPTQIIRGANRSHPHRSQTTIKYHDASHLITTTSDRSGYGDNLLKGETVYDGLGRTVETRQYGPGPAACPSECYSLTQQTYDALGRAKQTSNPYWRHENPVWTTTQYDALGRALSVTTPDNAVVATAYSGARVLVTDQAGKQRLSETDALGRLLKVWEIKPYDPSDTALVSVSSFPNHPGVTHGYSTSYVYDALDNLTTVTQQIGASGTVQTRSFVYDSLKRLTSTANPENGTITYQYDPNGNLAQKMDARPVTTHFTYDALNRPVTKSYNPNTTLATPSVNYYYDGQGLPNNAPSFNRGSATGRLVAVTYSGTSAGSYYGYDPLGQTVLSVQQTDLNNYQLSYGYDVAGNMISETYPSGRVITTSYDAAGRISGVKRTGAGWSYASLFSYAAHGAVKEMQLGNGLWERMTFNNRLQVEQIKLETMDAATGYLRLGYGYGTTDNNGNVRSQTINFAAIGTAPGLSVTQNYEYDALNRLIEARENETNWKQRFVYDRYGNRRFDLANTTPNVQGPNPVIDVTNNRISASQGYNYDPVGNLERDLANYLLNYDAENRLVRASNSIGAIYGAYSYDGEGQRVKKVAGGVTTIFVYNAQGQLIAEYKDVAPAAGIGGTKYLTADHLGSTRLVTSGGSGAVKARYDYLPFGGEIATGIGGRSSEMKYSNTLETLRQKFGSKERDTETGLDYFLARYYSNVQGRFSGVDPENAGAYGGIPQTWNGYTYALNNPLLYSDPNGRKVKVCDANNYCADIDDGTAKEYLFNRDYLKSIGLTIDGKGKIFDTSGNQLGTYRRISFDDLPSFGSGVLFETARYAPAIKQGIGAAALPYVAGAGVAAGGALLGAGVGAGSSSIISISPYALANLGIFTTRIYQQVARIAGSTASLEAARDALSKVLFQADKFLQIHNIGTQSNPIWGSLRDRIGLAKIGETIFIVQTNANGQIVATYGALSSLVK